MPWQVPRPSLVQATALGLSADTDISNRTAQSHPKPYFPDAQTVH